MFPLDMLAAIGATAALVESPKSVSMSGLDSVPLLLPSALQHYNGCISTVLKCEDKFISVLHSWVSQHGCLLIS